MNCIKCGRDGLPMASLDLMQRCPFCAGQSPTDENWQAGYTAGWEAAVDRLAEAEQKLDQLRTENEALRDIIDDLRAQLNDVPKVLIAGEAMS